MPSPSVLTPAARVPWGSTGPSWKVLACLTSHVHTRAEHSLTPSLEPRMPGQHRAALPGGGPPTEDSLGGGPGPSLPQTSGEVVLPTQASVSPVRQKPDI